MVVETIEKAEVWNMETLYDKTVAGIEIILKHRYKMKTADVKKAITISPLKDVFEQDPEMAAHTSNEAWAREVYKFWKIRHLR